MDGTRVREWEARCVEEQAPACAASCPVHVDARAMLAHLAQGRFRQAYEVYARAIPLPSIISLLCHHPCESACLRAQAGDPLRIHLLERACVAFGRTDIPLRTQRPSKRGRVAIVGAGISGLTAAIDLYTKGHDVTVFEAAAALLPRLCLLGEQTLPAAVIEADLARVPESRMALRLSETVDLTRLDGLLADFDAIYLAPGNGPRPDLAGWLDLDDKQRPIVDPLTFATSHPAVFAGGRLRHGDDGAPILSVHDGRYAALSIDRALQGASLTANRDNQGAYASRLYVDTSRHPAAPALPPDIGDAYGAEQAQKEAARCFPCHCLECVRVCPYLEHYGSHPKRYIREIYNNDSIVMGQHKSNRMVDSCMLCGLCAAVCPNQVSMADVCLEARQSMVDKGKMPPSHHEFALRDMAFSQGEAFALLRHQPGRRQSRYLFFPGCQLSASAPQHVLQIYAHLCATLEGGVGLMLGCCGAPARWAGREDLFAANLENLRAQWASFDQPRLITACSTCLRAFKDLDAAPAVESLWTVLEREGLPPRAASAPPVSDYAIHDPCTARQETAVQDSVRRLLDRLGVAHHELGAPGLGTCCGFGGLASFVNPEVADKVVDRRADEDPADYLAYCAMCRDNFARRGKRALHLLDLIFGAAADPAERADPGFSRRQENRARLKTELLRDLWQEATPTRAARPDLSIADDVRADLERKWILEEDVRQVVRHAENGGARLIDPDSGHVIASYRPAAITYWVEYAIEDGRCVVYRGYSHRMEVGDTP